MVNAALKSDAHSEWQYKCEMNIKLLRNAVIAHHARINYQLFNHPFLEGSYKSFQYNLYVCKLKGKGPYSTSLAGHLKH